MPTESRQRLVLKLRFRDLSELARLLGAGCRHAWWFRQWVRRYRHTLTQAEYQALMDGPLAAEAQPSLREGTP